MNIYEFLFLSAAFVLCFLQCRKLIMLPKAERSKAAVFGQVLLSAAAVVGVYIVYSLDYIC